MKALEKIGFAITDAGHKYDSVIYAADADSMDKKIKAGREYRIHHPLLGQISGISDPTALYVMEIQRNRAAHAAAKHAKKQNAYNPFAGWSDASYEKNKKAVEKILNSQKN